MTDRVVSERRVPPTKPSDEEMRWKAREAMDTLRRAEEFKRDKHLMRHVAKLHEATGKAIEISVKPVHLKTRR